jgi:ABC-type glycerol-3-phosphate transport system substrate-binding protein
MNSKKFAIFIAGIGVCLLLLGALPVNAQELTFWMQNYTTVNEQDALLAELAKAFKEETGITVNYEIIDWNQAVTKYTLACTGGEAPDVADLFWIPSFVTMGAGQHGPLELDKYIDRFGDVKERYVQAAFEEGYYNGHLYGLPWRYDARVLAYRTDLLKEAGLPGPPNTWDETIEYAKKLMKSDDQGNVSRWGLGLFNGGFRYDQTWFSILFQAGGKIMTPDYKKPAFNSPEGKASLQFMQDLVYKHKITNPNLVGGGYEAIPEFLAGKSAMLYGTTAELFPTIQGSAPHLKDVIKVTLQPMGKQRASVGWSAPIVVFRTTKDLEASLKWMEFLLRDKNQMKMATTFHLINSNKNVNTIFKDDPNVSVFAEMANYSQITDMPIPQWIDIDRWPDGPLANMINEVLAGTPVDQAATKAEEGVNKILAGK